MQDKILEKEDTLCHKALDVLIMLLMGLAFFHALSSDNFKAVTKYGLVWGAAGLVLMAFWRYRKKVRTVCSCFLDHTRLAVILLIVLGILQVLVFSLISGNILSDAGEIYQGVFAEDKTAIRNYLSLWQNNMPIYVYENLVKDILGLTEINQSTSAVYTVINIINYDLGFLCLSLLMKKLYGKKAGILTMYVCFFVLGLNNQMYQFYTTALSWPATCLGLYLYICIKTSDSFKKRLIFGGIWGAAVSCGYQVRPSSIIYLIAIFIFEAMHICRRKEYWLRTGSLCAVMLAGFFLFSGISRLAAMPYRLETDTDKNAVMTQYMAYGITGKGAGTPEVRAEITAAETTGERSQTAVRIWRERLKELGILGYPDFLVKKHLAETQDGTYGLMNPHIEEDYSSNVIVRLFQDFWYSGGRYVDLTAFVMQFVYVLFLLCILIGVRVKTPFSFVLKLSLLGWHAFLLLFEGARTGYTIQAFPVMIPLAVSGILSVLYGENGFGREKEKEQLEKDSV